MRWSFSCTCTCGPQKAIFPQHHTTVARHKLMTTTAVSGITLVATNLSTMIAGTIRATPMSTRENAGVWCVI